MGIDGFGCLLLAFGALLLPMRWYFALVLAAVFHEICHGAAAWVMGCKVHFLGFSWSGAGMSISPMTRKEELICAAAGPLGSISLVLWLRIFPELALLGLGQGLFNLLPLYPLDGGRIIRCLFGEKTGVKIHKWTGILLTIAAFAITFSLPSVGGLLLALVFFVKGVQLRKSSCKESNTAVQ